MSLLEELPYAPDASALFAHVADASWSMFLDSAHQGRYDILCADPSAMVVTRRGETRLFTRRGDSQLIENPFELLREKIGFDPGLDLPAPFAGGAVGYFGYDFGCMLEELPLAACSMPACAVGVYDWALVVDHQARRTWMAALGRDKRTHNMWRERVRQFSAPMGVDTRQFSLRGPITGDTGFEAYAAAFSRVQRYIRDGDCYQVNLARRFLAHIQGSPWAAYRRLRAVNPAPFSAYLNLPWGQVLSSSPERFLSVRGGKVETRPIKGTRPRTPDPLVDAALAEALRNSAKDRAENVMIVDLLRNDIGKSCTAGSVAVPSLFEVESFATVHHLVSTVTGELAPGKDALHLLAGSLPGGSITGAPKRRAMEIIAELEPHPREVYCGAIGYIGADGSMDTNVAIRTLVHDAGQMRFWAGGGIVADSSLEEEYMETEHKAAGMRRVFETDE